MESGQVKSLINWDMTKLPVLVFQFGGGILAKLICVAPEKVKKISFDCACWNK